MARRRPTPAGIAGPGFESPPVVARPSTFVRPLFISREGFVLRFGVLLLVPAILMPPDAAAQTKPPAPRPAAPRPPAQRRPAAPPAKPAPAPAARAPEPPKRVPPDVVLTTAHQSGDVRTVSTVQLKGARARINVGESLASIQQCDTKQTIQLNRQTRTYLEVPFAAPAATGSTAAIEGRKKGGQVTYSTTVTDTGETQAMFGLTARRLKIVVAKDFSVAACDKRPQRVETDGWYVELPATVSCATVPPHEEAFQVDPKNADCVDEIRYERARMTPGYPLKYTTVATSGDEPPVTTTMEVTAFERSDVAAAEVEVPADYMAVRTVPQLTADHRPGEAGTKRPGTLRIGLLPISNRSDAKLEADALNEAILESFSETDLDIVRLSGKSPAEYEADARTKEVDLLLTNTIAEVKTPRGGLVGKINGSSGEAFTAKVDYALVPLGQTKPRESGSERSGGSTLNSAINLAKKVAPFAPPLMMMKYGYMNAYGSMLSQQNAPGGAMRQTPDPVMNMAFSLLDRAGGKPAEEFSTEEGAVAAALEKVIKSVVSDVGKIAADAAKKAK
ncbi:MAG TPA: hypothetical protein VM032_06265 [Vicinamibacterales bacterium]|nr:hypothetical protein [Vicinamibacterales bacterium]